jgi:hypothetical protein
LITTKIEFRPECLPPHPSTTTHQEFTPEPFDSMSSDLEVDEFDVLYNKAPTSFEDDGTSDTRSEPADDAPMDLDDDGSSRTSGSEDEDRAMIKKPKGEVSKQYKLSDVLQKSGWAPEQIEKLKVSVILQKFMR